MSLGRYVSDLEPGDVLGPVEFELTPFMVREYCHAVELHHERVQTSQGQLAPITVLHPAKMILFRRVCPGGAGPDARLHVEFDATSFVPITVGRRLRVSGRVDRRFEKRGRNYMAMRIELHDAGTEALLACYDDVSLLRFSPRPVE